MRGASPVFDVGVAIAVSEDASGAVITAGRHATVTVITAARQATSQRWQGASLMITIVVAAAAADIATARL